MKTIKLIVLFILMSFTAHADLIEEINLSTIASGVDVQNGDLIIRTNKSGTKFAAVIDDHFDRVLKYDEVIRLPRGFKKAHFFEHHLGYRIEKEGNDDGVYNIQFRINMHSFGKDLTIHHVKFRIHDSSIEVLSTETEIIPVPSRAQKGNEDSNNLISNSEIGVLEAGHSSQNAKMPVISSCEDISHFKVIAFIALGLILIIWISCQRCNTQ